MLSDEVLTPDSSRFWPADDYPELPGDVVAATRGKYVEAYERITGQGF